MADEPEIIDFVTDSVGTEVMSGNGTDGTVRFTFFTPGGSPHLRTVFEPNLSARVAGNLTLALSNVPNLNAALGLSNPRKRPPKNPGEVLFGQAYPPEILQMLGLLMVRVNLLERSLVKLLSEIGTLQESQAEALFFSTVNMKARLGMITALSQSSGLTPYTYSLVEKAIQKATSVFNRRNDLVHGYWRLNNDQFEVETFQPLNVKKRSAQTVTTKSIEILTIDYRHAGILAEGCIDPIRHERDLNYQAT